MLDSRAVVFSMNYILKTVIISNSKFSYVSTTSQSQPLFKNMLEDSINENPDDISFEACIERIPADAHEVLHRLEDHIVC